MKLLTTMGNIWVMEKDHMEGMWGYWDASIREVGLHKDRPEERRDEILVHELMHVVETVLKSQGHIPRCVNHSFIIHGAPILLDLMKQMGRWKCET